MRYVTKKLRVKKKRRDEIKSGKYSLSLEYEQSVEKKIFFKKENILARNKVELWKRRFQRRGLDEVCDEEASCGEEGGSE